MLHNLLLWLVAFSSVSTVISGLHLAISCRLVQHGVWATRVLATLNNIINLYYFILWSVALKQSLLLWTFVSCCWNVDCGIIPGNVGYAIAIHHNINCFDSFVLCDVVHISRWNNIHSSLHFIWFIHRISPLIIMILVLIMYSNLSTSSTAICSCCIAVHSRHIPSSVRIRSDSWICAL